MKVKVIKEEEVSFIKAVCQVRYWEDAKVNDVEDEDGDLMPCQEGGLWCPIIELETGIIVNWEQGKTADIHYKICDAGTYTLFNATQEQVTSIDGYVPDIMCPEGDGYGDYIIMKIDADGKIQNWKVTLDEFDGREN